MESKGKRKKKEGRQQGGQEVRRQNESISGTARMSDELIDEESVTKTGKVRI